MNEEKTSQQYDEQAETCRVVFQNKTKDYGTSWRVLRISSLADQIFIKTQRIRTIDQLQIKKVAEEMDSEFIGIVNYAIIALIRIESGNEAEDELPADILLGLYNKKMVQAKMLMLAKNHDYGEAWRDMLIASFTDLIMMRVLRIRRIAQNEGRTIASEGIESNLFDIINYAIFALIKISEQK